MKENKLKYTGLTYDEIYRQVNDLIKADSRFDNFRESAIAQTLIEIFAGSTDIINYYIQRRAEECFFDTAQLKSSVISKSRELAYDITRATPATSTITLTIKGDIANKLTSSNAQPTFITDPENPAYKSSVGTPVVIQVPYYSKFSGAGNDFVLTTTLTINITYDIWDKMTSMGADYEQDFLTDSWGNPIGITQGEVKEKIISGQSNTQTGAPFQIYKIEDNTFSNIYGDKDYFFNNVTQVYVGENKSDATQYIIERKSLLNWETMVTSDLDEVQKVCLIRTANDETIELLFGDDKYAAKGPETHKDNIFVQYLSTNGLGGNTVGVIGDSISYSGQVYTNNGVDVTQFSEFKFQSNILGGSDMETMDSIKYYSPKLFYSLDRISSKPDYLAYLKSLKTPILVKNAIAWGEQEERDKYNKFAIAKMFNAVLFCVVGSLYKQDENGWVPKSTDELEDTVLDNTYDPYAFNIQGYFNVFVTKDQVAQLRRYIIDTSYNAVKGRTLPDGIWATIKARYATNDTFLELKYTSDEVINASNVEGSKLNTSTFDTSLRIDISSISVDSSDDDGGMSALADVINDAFVATMDYRANGSDNVNYDKEAFIGRFFDDLNPSVAPKVIVWNSELNQFALSFNEKERNGSSKSPCYVTEILEGSFADDIGLGGEAQLGVSEGEQGTISSKITDLVSELETRSQISTKHVYVSPIIHKFNIVGNITMRSLFDREQTRKEINDALYEFLDDANDFNSPLYLSNVIEIVENHPAVIYADIKLEPEDITNGINNTINKWYDSGVTNTILRNYTLDDNTNPIYDDIVTALRDYLSRSSYIPDDWKRYFSIKYISGTDNETSILEESYYKINNYITERTFYVDFVTPLYTKFKGLAQEMPLAGCGYDSYTCTIDDGYGNPIQSPNYRKFIGYYDEPQEYNSYNIFDDVVGSDFSDLLTEIHKDFSYIIMANMLDTKGNVRDEYDANGRYIRGGYSLESELIQVNAQNINYTYDM